MLKPVVNGRYHVISKALSIIAFVYFGIQTFTNLHTVAIASGSQSVSEGLITFIICFVPVVFFYIAYQKHSTVSSKWVTVFESILATTLAIGFWDVVANFLKSFKIAQNNVEFLLAALITALILGFVLKKLKNQGAW